MIPFPSNTVQFVDRRGYISEVWQLFLAQFVAQPAPVAPVTPSGSPFSYQVAAPGVVYVVGGNVSAISITRGPVTVPTGLTAGSFVLAQNDTLVITYTVAPTVTFLPG